MCLITPTEQTFRCVEPVIVLEFLEDVMEVNEEDQIEFLTKFHEMDAERFQQGNKIFGQYKVEEKVKSPLKF